MFAYQAEPIGLDLPSDEPAIDANPLIDRYPIGGGSARSPR